MSYAKPIWNNVTNCGYKGSKSYGNQDTGEVEILVGSSASNSHLLVNHFTTRRFKEEYKGLKNVCVFKFGIEIDNHKIVVTEKIFKDNGGRAGSLLKTINMRKVKGL
jgi:hypothetical protein